MARSRSRATRPGSTARPAPAARPAASPAPWAAWVVPVLALVAAALVQWRALAAPFFADDWLFLDQSRQRSLLAAALSPDPIGNFFRPLGRVLWFWTLGHASGESAAFFHAANLALWLASVLMLWAIARRLGGDRVAAVAAGVFALTYAADVPVMWASGAQDLLALALALGALLAVADGRLRAGAALLFLAPFAKETAVVAVLPALLLARRPGEKWGAAVRRAWPLPAAALAWALVAGVVFARRASPGSGLSLSPWGALAALADLTRVAFGLEWATGHAPWAPPAVPRGAALVAIALAGVAVALVVVRSGPGRGAAAGKKGAGAAKAAALPGPVPGAWAVAAAWAVAGALPVAAVAPVWSAYYLLFAMAGVGLLAGLAVARAPGGVAAGVVLLAGLAAAQPRALPEFATAPSPWSAQSHVNGFYLERGMGVMERCVDDLRAAHPSVPSSSTFFFSGVPAFAAVQVGDGPLVRGVYRDTTLRSYFASAFRRSLLGRGDVFLLSWDDESRRLVDHTNEPDLWFNLGIGWLLNDHPETAVEAFALDLARDPRRASSRFGLAIARASLGDTAAARTELLRLGFGLARDAGPVGDGARRALLAGDSLTARRLGETASAHAAYDPVPHLVLSRIYAGEPDRAASAVLEAAAAAAFAPGYAGAWRNWSAVQQQFRHYSEALTSLERYFELDPTAEREDPEAVDWRDRLRQMQPGGVRAQKALRNDVLPARR